MISVVPLFPPQEGEGLLRCHVFIEVGRSCSFSAMIIMNICDHVLIVVCKAVLKNNSYLKYVYFSPLFYLFEIPIEDFKAMTKIWAFPS